MSKFFDLLQDKTYNPFDDEIKTPFDALFWSAKDGNFTAQKAYLEITNPAEWNPQSKEYKERISKENQPRPFTIDDKYSIICTKQQLKTYYPEAYKKYFENE